MPSPPSAFPNCSCFMAISQLVRKSLALAKQDRELGHHLSLNNIPFSVMEYASKKNTSTSLLPHYSQTPWQANIGYLLIKGM